MSLRLCFILFLFTSPLYASCHNDVIDAAANASYVHKIQQVTASDRVYLYSAPNVQCRLNTFLVNGDPVQVFREATEYRDPHSTRHSVPQQYNYISFRDAQGLFVTGWVQASQLLDVTSPLNAPTGCQNNLISHFKDKKPCMSRMKKSLSGFWSKACVVLLCPFA